MHIPDKFYRVSAKALIRDLSGKVLLIEEPDDKGWELPGGSVEYGESLVVALEREIFEETGFLVESIEPRPAAAWLDEVTHHDGSRSHVCMIAYNVAIKEGVFKQSNEAQQFGYFSPEEMLHMNIHMNIQKLPKILL